MNPSSQKSGERPIGFVLKDDTVDGLPIFAPLVIRPEDLSRPQASRLNATQTLGGAWVDNFGPGMASIQISGHTGWRGSSSRDGIAEFKFLYDTVFTQWHSRRDNALLNGLDPQDVHLYFADRLDDIVCEVAPQSFTLKRNKSRPLLVMYNISLLVSREGVVVPEFPKLPSGSELFDLGMKGLTDAVDTITEAIDGIGSWIETNIAGPVRGFMQLTANVLNQVRRIQRSIDGVASSLIRVAVNLSQAGANIFHAINGILSIPARIKARLMEVAGAFTTAFCVIKRMFGNLLTMPDYSSMYGASNCSSTGGGRPLSPLSNVNPFYGVPSASPQSTGQIGMATSALDRLKNLDIIGVKDKNGVNGMVADVRAVNNGLAVA
jgi:hypothetical protein